MSIFDNAWVAPPDPILGVTDLFKADHRPVKANLGVGIYQDEAGNLPLLECVRRAEQELAAKPSPRPYLPIDGGVAYTELTRDLVLGGFQEGIDIRSAITVQTLGGSGAVKVGGDLLYSLGARQVLVSDPTWDNHLPILGGCGLSLGRYRYFDDALHGVNFDAMLTDISAADPGTVIVLHACCHNPTGFDLTHDQWAQLIDVLEEDELIAFVDMAYQGFAVGIDADAWPVREIARRRLPLLCANSFSKTFGLYGERVGGLTIVADNLDQALALRSQAKLRVRANYSNPPTHGQAIVSMVLYSDELRALWVQEVDAMRERIHEMRAGLVAGLRDAGLDGDFSYVLQQQGMFSYLGLTPAQMIRLREEFAVYGVESGRLCVTGLNTANLGWVCQAIATVMGTQEGVAK